MANNPLNILFICSQNRKRSPTAEEIYSEFEHLKTRSAGLNKGSEYLLEPEDISWADIIFVMEKTHLRNLEKKFSIYLKDKKIINLNIPDKYPYMDAALVKILRAKIDKYVL